MLDEIEELSAVNQKAVSQPDRDVPGTIPPELEADREEHAKLLAEMRESMPEHQEVLTLLRDREEKARQKTKMEDG